ncbi:MAG: tRNA (adenosine(37)-N6)-threonylcarbamoyltransferase complex dimerization subunit type 1 TsaB [Candidatus Latescibacterota bacterium]|nr:MAG: tRNA (adenosine(37)-N6)-threonylcarbamoyltransferase complex dimerization subunit type 1 TsaB [Candidatus Latescibacterota bacterium]
MMQILAVDTSQPTGRVAVSTGDGYFKDLPLERPSSHLVELGRAVSQLLDEAGITIDEIDRVALVSGPGSFTGLRVGMAYVKGLHAGLATDVVAVTSLDVLAVQASRGDIPVAPMIDARKDEVYAALYIPSDFQTDTDKQEAKSAPSLGVRQIAPAAALPPSEFLASVGKRAAVFVGSGVVRYRSLVTERFGDRAVFAADDDHAPSLRVLCRLATTLTPLSADQTVALEPFYIRSSGAKLKPLRKISMND